MRHPLLGDLRFDEDEGGWVGVLALPALAAFGAPVVADFLAAFPGDEGLRARAELYRRGLFEVLVHAPDGEPPTAAQEQAVRHLAANEAAVSEAVARSLAEAFDGAGPADLMSRAWCRRVEVADRGSRKQSYLGFEFAAAAYEEAPVSVIYHPRREPWWAEGTVPDALDADEDADG